MKRLMFLATGAIATCFGVPSGFKQVAGKVKLRKGGKMQSLTVSSNSVVHWDEFSIQSNEKVEFHMINPKCAVLNRVLGKNKSTIHGKLQSNGRVYLINEKGILIGASAHIQTAGFLATTGKINDQQFLQGKDLDVNALADAGVIDHRGLIETKNGDVYLIASKVVNSGKIIAPEGHVGIAVGQEVLIKPNGPERIFIRPGKPLPSKDRMLFAAPEKALAIENLGTIDALVTEIKTHRHPYTEAITHSGKIQATRLKKQKGRVLLISEDHKVTCSGEVCVPGGCVKIDAEDSVTLTKKAHIDVSDHVQPGKIEIGSRSTRLVDIDGNAIIHADNLKKGNGGEVVVLSQQSTRFFGTITAEAKGSFGDGGKVEVSTAGANGLSFKGKTSLKSKNGKDGLLLLDPQFAIIRSDGTDPATGNTFSNNPSGTVTISGSDLGAALNSANVVIQANTDITLDDTVTATTTGNGLTLQAGRSITFATDSVLTLNNGDLNVMINDTDALHYDRSPGGAGFFSFGPVTINTQGGHITFDVGVCGGVQGGTMNLIKTMMDARGGNIAIHGYGCFENARGLATNIAECSQIITSGSGTIDITGQAVSGEVTPLGNPHNAGFSNNYGIFATGLENEANKIRTENGNITITGVGASEDLGFNNGGIYFSMTEVVSTGIGSVTISGTAGSGNSSNNGFVFNGPMSKVETTTGAIQITGQGNGIGQANIGIDISAGAMVAPTGAATITLQATGGSGTNMCSGMMLDGGSAGVIGQGGAINITANANGSNSSNAGFLIGSAGFVTNTGNGSITINGTASGTGTLNMGVEVMGKGVAITSVDGDINLTGTGSGAPPSNLGVFIQDPGTVDATGTGRVNIVSNTP